MAHSTSTSCCLNFSPSTPTTKKKNPSLSLAPSLIPWERKEGSWKRRCFLGMACTLIIGLEMGPLRRECGAFAADLGFVNEVEEEERKVERWSDKRRCLPWRVNSLEIIVPENLPRPRPFSHRKSVAVSDSPIAPVVQITAATNTSCFSL
ncbi:hypothetical protein HHK36_025718 [Tetracentron sinense]|uniref:Uncharacterized protein n=1 Tax=Tetracentron sinense TaxID=13715 RepID=A0A834YLV9_TETSI|nr:hypothetical protein HHK36_025718 [Tetracentron sinense]